MAEARPAFLAWTSDWTTVDRGKQTLLVDIPPRRQPTPPAPTPGVPERERVTEGREGYREGPREREGRTHRSTIRE